MFEHSKSFVLKGNEERERGLRFYSFFSFTINTVLRYVTVCLHNTDESVNSYPAFRVNLESYRDVAGVRGSRATVRTCGVRV